mmetsp:Transcript_4794/g.21694  ORF Transcript_4794/g.21694 Transcript_4794/m.21694 type:complete len:229 (-) Transcript_4794:576-1262(-)
MSATLACAAIALAALVLPVPGGPSNSKALGRFVASLTSFLVPAATASYTSGLNNARRSVSSISLFCASYPTSDPHTDEPVVLSSSVSPWSLRYTLAPIPSSAVTNLSTSSDSGSAPALTAPPPGTFTRTAFMPARSQPPLTALTIALASVGVSDPRLENSTSDGAPPTLGATKRAESAESSRASPPPRPIHPRFPAPFGVTRSWCATSEQCAWTEYSLLASCPLAASC